MSETKEKKKFCFSIRSSIVISMSVLVLVMLGILWLTQTVFLSHIYKYTKESETKHASSIIIDNIDSENLESLVKKISTEYGVCAEVIKYQSNEVICSSHFLDDCIIHKLQMDSTLLSSWHEQAESKGGTFTEILPRNKFRDFVYNPDDFDGEVPEKNEYNNCVISVSLANLSDGTSVMVIINSFAIPLNSTVKTIKIELAAITILMIAAASVIAYFLSSKLSSPIIKISKEAKNLANANYDVVFPDEGTVEIRELAKTLNYTVGELSKVDKMQKELIANISHDLRTPLTMISGYSEVMRDIPGENTPENMQVIIDETARLSSLVNDLLDVSRFQSGSQKLNLSRFNITKSIKLVIKRYDKLKAHDGYKIDFVYDTEAFVNADEIRILQVIYNLINNAINYTGDDKTVTVYQYVSDDIVKICVTDTGDGIAEKDLPLIWDRYYKVDKVHKRAFVGTGLGLSIVKNILLLHNCRFGVSSEVGKGSNFWFELKVYN